MIHYFLQHLQNTPKGLVMANTDSLKLPCYMLFSQVTMSLVYSNKNKCFLIPKLGYKYVKVIKIKDAW